MSDAKVLIDTSGWIEFFRKRSGQVGDLVAQLVDLEQALITGVVVAELLQGVKHPREAESLSNMLSVLPLLDTLQADWMETGNTLRSLRKRGITVPLTDALIATIAVRADAQVLTIDRHFDHLPAHCVPLTYSDD